MQARDSLIEIIIPNWNGKELLADCLDSLKRQTSQEFSVTVIDNGSTDGSTAYLEERNERIKIIAFPENRGFSAAVNEGIRNSSADWLFLLNNDIEVAEDCIEQLLKAIDRYPDYSFFALRMMSYQHRNIFDGAGDAVLRGGVGYRVGTLEEDFGQYDSDRDVFGACAGAALYRSSLFAETGLFDEDFFAYLEDVDLNMRAVRYGKRCRYVSDACVYHIGSATTGSKINPTTIRLSTRNNFNILLKNYPLATALYMLPAILVYQLVWLLFVLKKKQFFSYTRGLAGAVKQVKVMISKRAAIKRASVLGDNEFSLKLKESEREVVRSIMARRASQGKGNGVLQLYWKMFL